MIDVILYRSMVPYLEHLQVSVLEQARASSKTNLFIINNNNNI